MSAITPTESRKILDLIIHRTVQTYRWAVIATFALVGVGFAITIFSNEQVETEMGNPGEVLRNLLDGHASGFFGAGIGVMILTPVVTVAAAAATFFWAGDRRYGLITTAVAIILTLSIAFAFVTG